MSVPDEVEWAGNLFGTQYSSLLRFLVARLRQRETAEDLAQEAFLRLLRVPDADLIRQPDAYLFRIALNLLSEYRMREQRAPVVFDSERSQRAEESANAQTRPMETLIDGEHLAWVLGQLPIRCRTALVLHRRDGLTYAQIAGQLGVSQDTVKKYIASAVARCRLAFGTPGAAARDSSGNDQGEAS